TSGWFLKNDLDSVPLGQRIAELQEARKALEPKLTSLLPAFSRERIEERRHGLFKGGAPEKLAEKLALAEVAAPRFTKPRAITKIHRSIQCRLCTYRLEGSRQSSEFQKHRNSAHWLG
ncbi:NAD-glutamate dehydrogenase domain-containing protein, partial [Mesorhizobium sp. M2E.F.Ca.ET.154.01.1.1]|uniref:NAD-glutamate dehydrogenase domain-containing protein n=1 Tax=Mesorhizobium sp. M2E.F.Ca.ET.154.01.1.1 TaxID=2500521 RepID=UPI0010926417